MRQIFQKAISGVILVLLLVWMGWFKLGMAEAEEYTVRVEHPRLILTPEKMEQVMTKVQANDPDWQSMYQSRYAYTAGSTLPSPIEDFLLKWALLFKITKEKVFIDRIREVLWQRNMLDTVGYQGRDAFRNVALEYLEVYDWFYDDWTLTEREDFKNHIITWFSYWRNYVHYDNNFTGYRWSDSDETWSLMRSFLAMGLVLYGDDANAAISIDIANRMWLKSEEIFWPRMGGVTLEGSYYGPDTRSYALEYLLLLKSGQGADLSMYSDFLKEHIYFLLYRTSPDFKWSYSFGDIEGPTDEYGSEANERRSGYYVLRLLELLKGTEETGYLREWIDSVYNLPFQSRSTDTRVMEMLFNDRLAPRLSYNALPVSRYFEKGGIIFSRSGWDFSDDAVWFGFQSKKWFVDHMHYDLLSYQIMRGDDFLTREMSGYWAESALGRAHNTILVKNQVNDYSGGGNTYTDGECQLVAFIAEQDYTYIAMDGSLAYSAFINQYWDSTADKVVRKFLYLKPNFFIVFDIIKTVDTIANANKAVSIRFQQEPIINRNIMSSSEGNSRIFVKYLSPLMSDLKITKIDESDYYRNATDYGAPLNQRRWHILTESISNPSLVHFMHIIEVGDIGLTQMQPAELVETLTNNMVGVQVGNRISLFSSDYSKTQLEEPIIYNVQGLGTSKHLICDLKPNTQFTITNTNLDTGQVVQTQTKASSSQGTLYFEATLGSNHQISIIPGGPVPVRGDVNGDALVNVVDVQLAVNQFLGMLPQTQEADLNGDGVVNVIDVQLVVNIILGG